MNPGILPYCKPHPLIAILCVEQALVSAGIAGVRALDFCCGGWRRRLGLLVDAVGGVRRAGTRTAARRPVMRGSRRLQWLAGRLVGGGAVLAAVALGAAASRGGVGPCGGPSGAVTWFLGRSLWGERLLVAA